MEWKPGMQVICIKDYGDLKQGDKGVVVEFYSDIFNWIVTISYKDGSKKVNIREPRDMETYFAKI